MRVAYVLSFVLGFRLQPNHNDKPCIQLGWTPHNSVNLAQNSDDGSYEHFAHCPQANKYSCKITETLTGLLVDNCDPLQGRYKQVMLCRKQNKYQTVLLSNIFIDSNFSAAVAGDI
jgi:hypothetical protein